MTRKTLREQLRDHYDAAALSDAGLARMKAMADVEGRPAVARRTWAGIAALAAGLVLWFAASDFNGSVAPLAQRVAEEVALNHEKQLRVDVEASSTSGLRARMDRLDFDPVDAPRLASLDATLVGARYCSLQGQIAAQLEFRTRTGERLTLYETRAGERFEALEAGSHRIRGTLVEVWSEGGLVFGLASDADQRLE